MKVTPDSSILVLQQTRMIRCGKVSGYVRQIVHTTKPSEFTRHRIHFRFRIQNLQRFYQIVTFSIRIHLPHLFKNDKTNPVTKLSRFLTNWEKYGALLYDRWLTCVSQWTQTRGKVFYKLLMSFHMQKKLMGLKSNQVFNQRRFFRWGGGGGSKRFGELCVPLKKSWLRPCVLLKRIDFNERSDIHSACLQWVMLFLFPFLSHRTFVT